MPKLTVDTLGLQRTNVLQIETTVSSVLCAVTVLPTAMQVFNYPFSDCPHSQHLDLTISHVFHVCFFSVYLHFSCIIIVVVVGKRERKKSGGILRACSAYGGRGTTLEKQLFPLPFQGYQQSDLGHKAWAASAFTSTAFACLMWGISCRCFIPSALIS